MGRWASLFSGGKDSSFALYRAEASGFDVTQLVTVHPPNGSYLYHVPATHLTVLAAESIGIPLLEIEPVLAVEDVDDSGTQGDRELEPLEAALTDLHDEIGLEGVTAGAVESVYQADRIQRMCDRLGVKLFAPLWGRDPPEIAEAMLTAGFEILIVQVAADGLDKSWLGRTLDRQAFSELAQLADRRGVHLLGEGGEYETLVTDGPHMTRPIRVTYDVEWDGTHGRLRIEDAWLG